MISLSRDELLKIVGGKSVPHQGKLVFQGVEFDSREIKGGELFVALKGEKSHGHEFIPQAIDRGASLFLVEDPALLSTQKTPERFIIVRDTLKALSTLAQWWRRELKIPVLGVTGSVGKTTIKEMTAAILLRHSRGVYSAKSHNNHVGVPYTILRLGREHKWAVLEMGMNHAGELKNLSAIAEPDAVLISNIAPAHIGLLGSLEAIARAKLEILEGLKESGTIILNGDDDVLEGEFLALNPQPAQRVLYFGERSNSSARITKTVSRGLDGIDFDSEVLGTKFSLALSAVGRHSAKNATAAMLAAKTLIPEISDESINKGLTEFRAPLMRLNIKELANGKKVIDDSYNANPSSMAALLELGKDLHSDKVRVGAVLGDMLELGVYTERYHREVGKVAAGAGLSFLVAVGNSARFYVDEVKPSGIPCFEAENPEVAAHIARKLNFDILLVKGSRGIGLDRTVSVLEGRS